MIYLEQYFTITYTTEYIVCKKYCLPFWPPYGILDKEYVKL
jgi:hypothetical protein